MKRDVVVVNGIEERHPEGGYYLERTEGTRRVRLSVGKDPQDAEQQRQRKEAELNAKGNGIAVDRPHSGYNQAASSGGKHWSS
ncbi:MAG TPA: hypothetical protein VMG82_28820 [Candidatus Sulfotelmatobacter sp.]|nr:hypothetical protein [Candidatus Sulfotelmatobacter sp.]